MTGMPVTGHTGTAAAADPATAAAAGPYPSWIHGYTRPNITRIQLHLPTRSSVLVPLYPLLAHLQLVLLHLLLHLTQVHLLVLPLVRLFLHTLVPILVLVLLLHFRQLL